MDLPAAAASTPAANAGVHLHLTPFGIGVLVLIAIVLLVAYRISLYLNPHTVCRPCAGTGKRRGVIFFWARRVCGSCGGNGLAPRLGTCFTGRR